MSLKGKVIAISGKLSKTRDEIVKIIENSGGVFTRTLNKKTTHLIANNPSKTTAKITKAKDMGIQIVDETFLPTTSQIVGQKRERPKESEVSNPTEKKLSKKNPSLTGKVIAITGKLSFPRSHFESLILANGGTFAPSVTKKVTHLIAADPDAATTKLEKARKSGIKIVGENFLDGLTLNPIIESEDNCATSESSAPQPKNKMNDGDVVKVSGGSSDYEIRFRSGVYYCTCMGWKMQNAPVDKRTCKHMRKYLGDEFETWRTEMQLPEIIVPKESAPKVLLAEKYDEEKHNVDGWWVSEKLDGVRAFWDGSKFLSRNGNKFYAPEWFVKDFPKHDTLDGELFMGRKMFQQTVSIVKSFDASDRWKQLKYMIFDVPSQGQKPFEDRMKYLKDNYETLEYVKIVEQTKLSSKEEVPTKLEALEKLGAEGLMLRKPASLYEQRRSTTLLKVKSWHDDEAIVIDYATKGRGRLAGMAGSLQVRNRAGKEFKVGSGLTDEQRRNPPAIGTVITYKYQELTNAGVPRFPKFVGICIDKKFP